MVNNTLATRLWRDQTRVIKRALSVADALAVGVAEAGREAELHRIDSNAEDDWNRRGYCLNGELRRRRLWSFALFWHLPDVRSSPNFRHPAALRLLTRSAMCGRLRVGKENLHVAGLVGAAMCSAFECGSHDRWP
jgi:hypothetical protein